MDSPKEILDSKYILLSKIGSGGTAEVYLSQDIKNNNISATKIQNKEEEEGKEKKGNIFKAESEILNSIKNENIVNIIDYGEGSIENEKGEKGEKYPYFTQLSYLICCQKDSNDNPVNALLEFKKKIISEEQIFKYHFLFKSLKHAFNSNVEDNNEFYQFFLKEKNTTEIKINK